MMPGRRALLTAAALALTLAVYWPALDAGFVGDDFMILYRLRQLTAPADVARFFTSEFFEYYRPAGFVAHAADYALAGADPRQFHLTNLALHLASTLLVGAIAVRLSPGSPAGPLAALLFGLHPSNHEAVVWMSARFDLLATAFGLAALWWMLRPHRPPVVSAGLFAIAMLSKESVVALPLAAAGWAVFGERSTAIRAGRRIAPWIAALAAYALLRHFLGGVSAVGGGSRLPKLIGLVAFTGVVLLLADGRWETVRDWLRPRRRQAALAAAAVLGAAVVTAALSDGGAGRLVSEKLAVGGFATFHLLSPWVDLPGVPFYLSADTTAYWAVGAALLGGAALLVIALWNRLLPDPRMWFLASALVAALLPISALTEGQRYLYLPSAVFCVMAAVLAGEIVRTGRRRVAFVILAVVLGTSIAQIARKIGDWRWAARMTADGARLVDRTLAPACDSGDVVFLTSPVSVRGVYTHFYYETFELPRGCRPESFHVLVRTLRVDTEVNAAWEGPDRISILVPRYPGTYVLSDDLRHFDRPLRQGATERVETPLGLLRTEPYGEQGMRLSLTLTAPVAARPPLFFYYSDGEIRPLPPRP